MVALMLATMPQARARAEDPAVVGLPVGVSVVVAPAVLADVESEERMSMVMVVALRHPADVRVAPVPLYVSRREDAARIPEPAVVVVKVPSPIVVRKPAPALQRDPAETGRRICPTAVPIGLPALRDVRSPGRYPLDGHPGTVVAERCGFVLQLLFDEWRPRLADSILAVISPDLEQIGSPRGSDGNTAPTAARDKRLFLGANQGGTAGSDDFDVPSADRETGRIEAFDRDQGLGVLLEEKLSALRLDDRRPLSRRRIDHDVVETSRFEPNGGLGGLAVRGARQGKELDRGVLVETNPAPICEHGFESRRRVHTKDVTRKEGELLFCFRLFACLRFRDGRATLEHAYVAVGAVLVLSTQGRGAHDDEEKQGCR